MPVEPETSDHRRDIRRGDAGGRSGSACRSESLLAWCFEPAMNSRARQSSLAGVRFQCRDQHTDTGKLPLWFIPPSDRTSLLLGVVTERGFGIARP